MISENDPKICPLCDGSLKRYDRVNRIVKSEYGKIETVRLTRYKCIKCGSIHRELPEYLKPYKQFNADIINGMVDGSINHDDLKYEDYPHEVTVKRWTKEFKS